jgi:hypothetical protein
VDSDQKRQLQSARRAHGWLGAHPDVVGDPTTPGLAQHFDALGTVVSKLGVAAAGQEVHFLSAKGATAEVKRLRRELIRQHMRGVATVARVAIPDVAKMTVALQVPKEPTDIEGLLASADAMATAAEQYQDTLVKQGLPTDALTRLREVAEQYRSAIDARGQSIANRRGATEAVDALLAQARKHVNTISVLLTRVLEGNRALLAEWQQLKRVTIKGVPGTATADAPATSVTQGAPVTPVPPEAGTPAPVQVAAMTPASTSATATPSAPVTSITPADTVATGQQ